MFSLLVFKLVLLIWFCYKHLLKIHFHLNRFIKKCMIKYYIHHIHHISALNDTLNTCMYYMKHVKTEPLILTYNIMLLYICNIHRYISKGKDTLWNVSFRGFHEIQFQGHFMKHKILSWNAFILVSNIHCVRFSSIKNCVCREKIPCKI